MHLELAAPFLSLIHSVIQWPFTENCATALFTIASVQMHISIALTTHTVVWELMLLDALCRVTVYNTTSGSLFASFTNCIGCHHGTMSL